MAIDDAAGLVPGIMLEPDVRARFEPFVVSFQMPCDATFGDLAVSITTELGTGSGDAPFLTDGSALPVGAVGAVGAAGLIGAALIAVHRRHLRRLRPARS